MTVHRVKTCACGHADNWHDKLVGGCIYGHGHVMGGCSCERFSKRRRPDVVAVTVSPAADRDSAIARAIDDTIAALGALRSALGTRTVPSVLAEPARAERPMRRAAVPTSPVKRETTAAGGLSGAERKVLTALAQHPEGLSRVQAAILAGYSHTSGGYRNTLSALRTSGRLEGGGERMRITDVGRHALGAFDPLPSGRALLAYCEAHAGGKCERLVLGELAAVHPRQLTKDAVASRTGYQATSGGFRNALSRLRTLQLVKGRGELGLTPALASAIGSS